MVAQLVRLKLHLLANMFRRSAWQVVGIVLGIAYGIGVSLLVTTILAGLRLAPDTGLIRDALVVAGSVVVAGFIVVPLILGVDDSMDPRRFALFGMPDRTLAIGLAVAATVGIPSVVLGIGLVGTVITWSRGFWVTLLALIAAAVAYGTCILLARVSTSIGAFALSTRRSREALGVLGIVLVVLAAPALLSLLTVDWARSGLRVLEQAAAVLGWTPLGAVWAVPGDAASGQVWTALLKLVIAGGTLVGLWYAWQWLVARMLVTPGREASARSYRGLGWFDVLLGTPSGAVAARTLTYVFRDARYWASYLILPIAPILVVVPLGIAGVDPSVLALIPVPMVALFLAWTVHNDVAMDHTAVWMHVASGVRGVSDRLGRLLPVLLVGVVVIAVGAPISAMFYGDIAVLPAIVGVSGCLLGSALGIGSIVSARFPYPAVKPGDSPFQAPQSSSSIAAFVQSITMLASIVFALPAVWFTWRGMSGLDRWYESALWSGLGIGAAVLVAGVLIGGAVFERRGPEILAAAQRA
ncbi:ABC transporter permease [Agromyces sp. SYSU T00194]|uniref:ABC transporter permease n=1 Tax=Agromyces chitinivorans TaxID=3158560 RepID=UPI003396EF38